MRTIHALLVAALLLATPATGWVGERERPHHADLAVLAVERLPPHVRDALLEHEDELRDGALYPDARIDPFYHRYEPETGDGGAMELFARTAANITRLRVAGDDPARLAFEVGVLTHVVLDLAQPMHSGTDAIDTPYHAEVEDEAWAHMAELDIAEREARVVSNVTSATIEMATQTAALAPRLEEAVEEAEGPWSPEIAAISEESLSLGLATTSDVILTLLTEDPDAIAPTLATPVEEDGEEAESIERRGERETPLGLAAPLAALALAAAAAGAVARRRR